MRLLESIAEFYPEALRQRCVVHSCRNVYSRVPRGKVRQATRMLKATLASEDPESARGKTDAYHKLPSEHWRRIRTNNPMERVMREIKRRTRVVGALPDGNGASMSSAARIRLSNKIEGRRFGFDVESAVLMSVPRGIAGTQQAESCGTAAFERGEDVSRDSRRTGASLPLDRNWETGIHRRQPGSALHDRLRRFRVIAVCRKPPNSGNTRKAFTNRAATAAEARKPLSPHA